MNFISLEGLVVLSIFISVFYAIIYVQNYYWKSLIKKYLQKTTLEPVSMKESRKTSALPVSLKISNSLEDHKKILLQLYEASDRCYIKLYAVKCISLITYCPHLINVRCGSKGYTAFHRVCVHGHAYLMEYMLAKGANVFLTNHTGKTPICLALEHFINNPDKTDFTCLKSLYNAGCRLKPYGKWYNVNMKAAIKSNNKQLIQWILVLTEPVINLSRSHSEL